MTEVLFHKTKQCRRLAYHKTEGKTPGILFLGGFKSDMTGTKAMALQRWCEQEGYAYTRFDYSGHGQSSGKFEEGTIGQWMEDAAAMLNDISHGPQILVGSSMGGWIMLLLARQYKQKIKGLVGIASAPDFTEYLIWQQMTDLQKKEMQQNGMFYLPACAGEDPYPITARLLENGRDHLLLDKEIDIACPVALIHGMADEDVPWQTSLKLAEKLAPAQVELTLVKGGGHRMSEPSHISLLCHTLARLHAQVSLSA